MTVKVERRHRELALQLLGHRSYYNDNDFGRKLRENWLENGERITLSSAYSHEWQVARAIAEAEVRGESKGASDERSDVVAELERVERTSGGDAAMAVRAVLVTVQRGEHVRTKR